VNEERFAALVDLCAAQGVRILWVDLGPHRHGQYRRQHRLIELNPRLVLRQLVPVLAHEYAHVVHDDACSTPATERRAWEYAARLLITPADYARAERIVGPHPNAIAAELDLTPVIVRAWRRQHRAAA
jgi:Zn-dependent peptidase ImmA (M78 family)